MVRRLALTLPRRHCSTRPLSSIRLSARSATAALSNFFALLLRPRSNQDYESYVYPLRNADLYQSLFCLSCLKLFSYVDEKCVSPFTRTLRTLHLLFQLLLDHQEPMKTEPMRSKMAGSGMGIMAFTPAQCLDSQIRLCISTTRL
jgi:hypothetical protein